eukprot:COSAG02_NODE_3832_length_6173_cov_15.610965_2_plen_102_part_00
MRNEIETRPARGVTRARDMISLILILILIPLILILILILILSVPDTYPVHVPVPVHVRVFELIFIENRFNPFDADTKFNGGNWQNSIWAAFLISVLQSRSF